MNLELDLRRAIIDKDYIEIESLCKTNKDPKRITNIILANSDIILVLEELDNEIVLKYEKEMYSLFNYCTLEEGIAKELLIKLYGIIKAKDKDFNGLYIVSKLIDCLSRNDYVNKTIDPLLKTIILLESQKKGLDIDIKLSRFCKYGKVDDEMISKFEDKINFSNISSNESVDISIIDKYADKITDWVPISIRKDLTSSFILNHYDKLCLDLVVIYNKDDIEFLKFIININNKLDKARKIIKNTYNKINLLNLKTQKECDDYIQNYLASYYIKIGVYNWNNIHRNIYLRESFILEHKDKLNIEDIKEYYNLSEEIKSKI